MSEKYLGETIGKLGFGFMRLPQKDGAVDYAPMKDMVDVFLGAGFSYFDTSHMYPGSEEALHETLVRRHPREKFHIATKLPLFLVSSLEDAQRIFETSLSRLGVDYIDFYLLHGYGLGSDDKAAQLGVWDFLRKLKAEGKIHHYGFSFHDTPENLDILLTRHPDTEFVQLQINYLDWDDVKVQSRSLYEVARSHNTPVTIMEPVKGGLLAGDGGQVEALFKSVNPDVSVASWAVRFAAGREGLITMLSGMNTMEQLQDNIKTIKALKPLTDSELVIVSEAVRLLNSVERVPCTGCKYCVEYCPQKLNIPYLIHLFNEFNVYKQKVSSGFPYMEATSGGRTPSTCVTCRSCEERCPQHIVISDIMAKMVPIFEE